jgi:photosystem II stability/assembly factor-like uncharacterized protein
MIRMIRRWSCVAGIVGVLFSGNPVFAQQWERLPLNVGYLDKLVQNPYNSMEIVGYIRDGDFFRSVDGGLSWKKIEQGNVPFKRAYIDLDFDSQSRLYLITAQDGLYRSSDNGATWDGLLVRGLEHFLGESRTSITRDGTILVWESGVMKGELLRSNDDGVSWHVIGPEVSQYDWYFYADEGNSDLIILLEMDRVIVTTDAGVTWNPYLLHPPARSFLFHQLRDTLLVLSYFSGRDSSEIFESCDTGKTWQQVTGQSIRVNQGDCLHDLFITEKRFRMTDSTEVYPICHTLQRSTDSGRTFQQITNFRVEDAVQVGTDLIASVPLRGLIRSTDFGDTWSPVPSPPDMFRVNNFEFAHAHDDTMFVLMGDWESNEKPIMKFLESDDGGYTWATLIDTTYFMNLIVDAGRPSRYYLDTGVPDDRYGDPKNRYSILSGVAGQSVPDTVLVTTSYSRPTELYPPETFQCVPSERFPGWIYASRNTNSIGWSSNRGESWEWRTLPISCSMVRPWPTQGNPLRIVVAASELNPIATFDYSGLYLTEDGGQSFEWINRSDRLGGRLFTTQSDRIFYYDSSSTDYGRTWETMREGLDSATTSVDHYQSHGRTLTITNTGMYLFDDDRWKLLRDADGNSIWDERMVAFRHGAAIYLDYSGTHVYVAIPDRGLYRIATQPVTSVVSPPIPTTGKLNVYPNPAGTKVTIAWQGIDESRGGLVRILDVLGREIARFNAPSEGDAIDWDCRGAGGHSISPGMYVIRFTDEREIVTTNVLILR